MIKEFVSLLFPQNCINCSQSLTAEEQYLCLPCKLSLPFTDDHANPSNKLLSKFISDPKIKSAQALCYFNKGGIVQKLLHHLKYKGKKEIGILLGEWSASNFEKESIDMIVPVPLHPSKFRKRTFNQSEQIAIGIANKLGVPVNDELVKREIATSSQTNKSKAQRWTNMENVYSKVEADLSNQSVLIVDDVITTGATVGMLCERLTEANVAEIHITSIARGK